MTPLGTISGSTRTFRAASSASSVIVPRPSTGPARRWETGPTRAETLECTCPEFCERDHEND
ncbi:MAG: hypothetical protein ACRC50_04920 [Gaiella sp.]